MTKIRMHISGFIMGFAKWGTWWMWRIMQMGPFFGAFSKIMASF